jgi:hypothetical protein
MPIMNVIVLIILLQDNVGIPIVELSMKLSLLLDRLKLLNAVHLQGLFPSYGEKGLSLSLKLLNFDIEFFSFHIYC